MADSRFPEPEMPARQGRRRGHLPGACAYGFGPLWQS
jgi:hypothetical protein